MRLLTWRPSCLRPFPPLTGPFMTNLLFISFPVTFESCWGKSPHPPEPSFISCCIHWTISHRVIGPCACFMHDLCVFRPGSSLEAKVHPETKAFVISWAFNDDSSVQYIIHSKWAISYSDEDTDTSQEWQYSTESASVASWQCLSCYTYLTFDLGPNQALWNIGHTLHSISRATILTFKQLIYLKSVLQSVTRWPCRLHLDDGFQCKAIETA